MTLPCGGAPRVCTAAELDQVPMAPPAQAMPVTAQLGLMVGNGRRFISVPWVLHKAHPSTERGLLKGAQCRSCTPPLLQLLTSSREQGIAGPWDTSIRLDRGGQGPTSFPWSPIPGQLLHVRRGSGLELLHPCRSSLPKQLCRAGW